VKAFHRAVVVCGLASASLCAGDPGPTQPPGVVNPPYHAAAINAPFPDNYYGADHGGSSLVLSYPFMSQFGNTDHSRGVIAYYCAPFTPRNSEGVYGMDVWLEVSGNGGFSWNVAGTNGGLADGAGSAYQPVNTPNPGPSPAYRWQWTFDDTPLPPEAVFRVWVYVYLYNQGGGSQGNFYVGTSAGSVSSGAANDAPLISWDASDGAVNPTGALAGQSYLISATGTDDNGNLAAVQILRNGSPFAAAGSRDGWQSAAAGGSADPAGTVTYTAQATDSDGLTSAVISLSVTTAALQNQPPVASADASIDLGQAFTPPELGGAGTGGWQFAIGGYTNFNAGATDDTGTDLPAGNWVGAWTASAAGSYAFWVSHNGDGDYAPSAVAGPYTLTVIDPNAITSPAAAISPDPSITSSPPVEMPSAPAQSVAPTTTGSPALLGTSAPPTTPTTTASPALLGTPTAPSTPASLSTPAAAGTPALLGAPPLPTPPPAASTQPALLVPGSESASNSTVDSSTSSSADPSVESPNVPTQPSTGATAVTPALLTTPTEPETPEVPDTPATPGTPALLGAPPAPTAPPAASSQPALLVPGSGSLSGSTADSSTSSSPSSSPTPTADPLQSRPDPSLIARIRFNASGHDATVHSAFSRGTSLLWTDPAGLVASPWPQFTPAAPATAVTGSFALPTH